MISLIQGFFFQSQHRLDIGYPHGEPQVFLREATLRSMFSGMFGPEHLGGAVLAGRMTDHYGESTLTDIKLDAESLSFIKQYDHRKDHILYQFRKRTDGTWRGVYTGVAAGTGSAYCILTTAPDDFLLPRAEKPARNPKRPVKRGGPRESSLIKYRR